MGGRTSQAEWNVDAAFLSWIWKDGPTTVTVHAFDWHKCMRKQSLLHQSSYQISLTSGAGIT